MLELLAERTNNTERPAYYLVRCCRPQVLQQRQRKGSVADQIRALRDAHRPDSRATAGARPTAVKPTQPQQSADGLAARPGQPPQTAESQKGSAQRKTRRKTAAPVHPEELARMAKVTFIVCRAPLNLLRDHTRRRL